MNDEQYQELRQKLEQLDDDMIVRVDAVLGVADYLYRRSTEQIESVAQRLEESHRQSTERMNQLDERLNQLTVNVNQLSRLMVQSIETANIDRATIQQNQIEIRRIWEYLMNQRPNGQQG